MSNFVEKIFCRTKQSYLVCNVVGDDDYVATLGTFWRLSGYHPNLFVDHNILIAVYIL